ncbi:MAG: hypothetical protein IPI48_18685 [bacterium]|nr:hypothetical protein [bacterium]
MPQPKGCLRPCALGCAGFAALLVIGGVIISTLAWKALNGATISGRWRTTRSPRWLAR